MKNVSRDVDRHGNERLYFRRRGYPKIRLHEKEGTPEFEAEVAAARLGVPYTAEIRIAARPAKPSLRKATPDSFRWLVEQYLSRHVVNQAPATRIKKRAVLEEMCRSTCLSLSGNAAGDMAFAGFELKHIALLRDEKAGAPEAANHRLKVLSSMYQWGIDNGLAKSNPARDCRKIKTNSEGHHTITADELERYEKRHPTGTKARLAYTIFLYTGLRVCDAAVFGRQHLYRVKLEDGGEQLRFRITPKKTAGSSKVVVDMAVSEPLAIELANAPKGNLPFLVTEWGKPFSVKGLGQWMRDRLDEAELNHCSSHGFRKAGATIAAENGATSQALMAAYGWTTLKEAEHYTRKAEKQRLADDASRRLALKTRVRTSI